MDGPGRRAVNGPPRSRRRASVDTGEACLVVATEASAPGSGRFFAPTCDAGPDRKVRRRRPFLAAPLFQPPA